MKSGYIALLVFVTFLFSVKVQAQVKNKRVSSINKVASHKNKFTFNIIRNPENTFGYDIYSEGKLIIHQNNIPAIQGNRGFKNKQQATKVAKLVIFKLKNGEMPPSVTLIELKKLGVVN